MEPYTTTKTITIIRRQLTSENISLKQMADCLGYFI